MADIVKRERKKPCFKVGSRISVPRTFFDSSEVVYSDELPKSILRLHGTVTYLSLLNKCTVEWDIDGHVSYVKPSELQLENDDLEHQSPITASSPSATTSHSAGSSVHFSINRDCPPPLCPDSDSSDDEEPLVPVTKKVQKRKPKSSCTIVKSSDKLIVKHPPSKKTKTDKRKGTPVIANDIDDDTVDVDGTIADSDSSDDEELLVPVTKKFQKRKPKSSRTIVKNSDKLVVKHPQSKKAKTDKRKGTPAIANDIDDVNPLDAGDSDDDTVDVDGTAADGPKVKWQKNGWTIDPRVSAGLAASYGPRMKDFDAETANELAFLLKFLPCSYIREVILPAINETLTPHMSFSEFINFLGLVYAMEVYNLPERRMYWQTDDNGHFPAMKFGQIMSRNRFEQILAHLKGSKATSPIDQILDYQDALNCEFARAFTLGDTVTLDESMVKSYHHDLFGKIKIIRKPRPIGNEIKNLADARSKLVSKLEIYEGKDRMKDKEFVSDFGATAATTLRLCHEIQGSGRVVIGDSWFGSVKTAVCLHKVGLYAIFLVKTAHKLYPLEKLAETSLERGEWVGLHAEVDGVPLQAVNFLDLQLKHFISTCSTVLPGPPRETKHCGEIARPKVAFEYLQSAAAIDIHNHVRTGSMGLEDALLTQSPFVRQFIGLTGFVFSNAFLAFRFFKDQSVLHSSFKINLANQLMDFREVEPVSRRISDTLLRIQNTQLAHRCEKLDDRGTRKQLRCYMCMHGEMGKKVLTSYYCVQCNESICSPTAPRPCWNNHLTKGLPVKKRRSSK